jgi:hypothetical protein
MSDLMAGEASGVTASRKVAKPSKKGKKPDGKVSRLQLHVPEEVVRRLAVHCGFKGTSWSEEASRILRSHLVREGKGREMFKDEPDPTLDPTE